MMMMMVVVVVITFISHLHHQLNALYIPNHPVLALIYALPNAH